MTAAVTQDCDALEYASYELKNNEQGVTAAVTQDGEVLRYASDELKNHEQVVTAAVTRKGAALYYASNNQRGNVGVVLAARRQNPFPCEYYLSQDFIVAAVTRYHHHGSNPDARIVDKPPEVAVASKRQKIDHFLD